MLRSTHKAPVAPPPLPEGWTEHKAPTGHLYYYHAATKKSTYTRPEQSVKTVSDPQLETQAAAIPPANGLPSHILGAFQAHRDHPQQHGGQWRSRNPKDDRPKHKKLIPGCEPWILVTTKFRRRFVYNPEQEESYWKFPQEVLIAVAELDRKEARRKERQANGEPSDSEVEDIKPVLDDDYEEVEVTDDEDMDVDTKRQRTDENQDEGGVEVDEDDFADQLALLEQGSYEDALHGEQHDLDPEDAKALFVDLLLDFNINPHSRWDDIIENEAFVEDPRYRCLPTTKARRSVFDAWSLALILETRAKEEEEQALRPKAARVAYLAFLDQQVKQEAKYWDQFKRAHKKEGVMTNSKLDNKEREKLYREHVKRKKLPQSKLKPDLIALLRKQPLQQLNRSTRLDALPDDVTAELEYISLPKAVREPLIQAHIDSLGPAPEGAELSAEEIATAAKAKSERQRRENALREREREVEENKQRRLKQERASRGLLKDREADVQRAMHVRGGLRGHIAEDNQDAMEE